MYIRVGQTRPNTSVYSFTNWHTEVCLKSANQLYILYYNCIYILKLSLPKIFLSRNENIIFMLYEGQYILKYTKHIMCGWSNNV